MSKFVDADMADAPFLLQRGKLAHGIEVAGVFEHPPMELQKVDAFDAKALQALGDASADDVCGHRSRRGTPLGEGRPGAASRPRAACAKIDR